MPLIPPISKHDKDAGKLFALIVEQDKDSGIFANFEIDIGDSRDFILIDKDKFLVIYKSDLTKGDQIDLSKFTQRCKVFECKANYVAPKTGWSLFPDRTETNFYGESA